MKRLDELGPDALVQIREPVNKFPDSVRYAAPRLKTLCRAWARSRWLKSCAAPDHLICDQASIFSCDDFKRWCKHKSICPRYEAVGKHGSIAVVEHFIRTIKDEGTWRILVLRRREAFRRELTSYLVWYNEHRPHNTLKGRTPHEVCLRLRPANRRPPIEPRLDRVYLGVVHTSRSLLFRRARIGGPPRFLRFERALDRTPDM